MPESPLTASKL